MHLMRDASLLFALLLLSGCNHVSPWIYHQTVTGCHEFDSALLKQVPENRFNGVEVEFLKGAFGTLGYINVYNRPISSPSILFEINKEKSVYEATCMEGGQRLLLPTQATDQLIEALLSEKQVRIYLNGYVSTMNGEGFPKLYQQFSKI